MKKSTTKTARKTREVEQLATEQTADGAKQPRNRDYVGAPIPATAVYRRTMGEFKNTSADAWMLINELAGTVTHANTYRGGHLPASYDPATYTYAINEKVVARKIDAMQEVEATDWPAWVVHAALASKKPASEGKTRRRKATAK